MLRIYLDQKDWIALLKAEAGKPERESHVDVLTLLQAGVAAGHVSVPLSHIHYQETAHRKPFASRLPLAALMARLSKFHTIGPFYRVAQDEMRHFIARNFDSAIAFPNPPKPFGRGGDHAFGMPVIEESLESLKAKFKPYATGVDEAVDSFGETFEFGLLSGHPNHDTRPTPADGMRKLETGEALRREERRTIRRQHGATIGDLSHRSKYATAYFEKQDDILAALAEMGVKVMPGNDVAITWFIEGVPTMSCDYELSRLKEEAMDRPWTANDLRDVWALCTALVYADIVVTEVSWGNLVNRELAKRLRTQVFTNVEELIPRLIAAAAADQN
jgi:hypothetical protein